MAQKRMFDKRVVESDKFTDLPNSSKALYFMAGMSADDKGFFQPRRLQKVCGFTDDDFKILIAKGYFIPFESGVIVITDWNKNNWLDSRRINETEYVDELKLLKLINERYELKEPCLASAKPMLRENRIEENRIEENRIEENSIYNISCKNEVNFAQEFDKIWSIYPNKKGKNNAKRDFIKARKSGITYEKIEEGLNNYLYYLKINKKQQQYILNGSTWFHQQRWDDEYTNKDLNTSGIISASEDYQEMLKRGLID